LDYSVNFYELNGDPDFQSALKVLFDRGAFATDLMVSFGKRISFAHDEKFSQALKNHPEGDVTHLMWRLHTACWAAHSCLKLDGAFVECGVLEATFSTMIIEYLSLKGSKEFFLFDSFEGIPEEYLDKGNNEEINFVQYHDHNQYEKIQDRFSDYENVHVIKGMLPGALEENCPEKIAFLHMDLSNYESERDVLEVLIDKIVPGGIVLFQGYEFELYRIWKIADDDFIKDRNIKILSLPTGQGMFIR